MTTLLEGPYRLVDFFVTPEAPEGIRGYAPAEGFIAALDLRPVEEQGPSGSLLSCVIEWDSSAPPPPGYSPASPAEVARRLTTDADPLGRRGPRPLMPGPGGRIRAAIGSHVVVERDLDLRRDRAIVGNWRRVYRELRRGRREDAQRWLWLEREKLQLTGRDLRRLLPPEFIDDDPIEPTTTVTETFDGPDSSTMGVDHVWDHHVWYDNLDNGGGKYASAGGTQVVAICQSQVSSADQRCELICFRDGALNTSGNTQAGPAIRHPNGSHTNRTLYWALLNGDRNTYLYKLIGGAFTLINQGALVTVRNGALVSLMGVGNDLTAGFNSDEVVVQGIDTAIPSGLFGGMVDRSNGISSGHINDDFVFTDELGPPSGRAGVEPIILRMMQGA